MAAYDIAIIPGDGVGNEVSREAIKILNAAAGIMALGLKRPILSGGVTIPWQTHNRGDVFDN
jgi:isocitrate/isopropylmalate dehydrogenase